MLTNRIHHLVAVGLVIVGVLSAVASAMSFTPWSPPQKYRRDLREQLEAEHAQSSN